MKLSSRYRHLYLLMFALASTQSLAGPDVPGGIAGTSRTAPAQSSRTQRFH